VTEAEREHYDKVFEEELLPHADALKTFAYHLTMRDADANDLVQETYLKAYRFIEKY
jgi:RNA polymerase sigma-70 factor (ECF subfamily)